MMRKIVNLFLSALCAATLLACAPACTSTVSPDHVSATQASYDGGARTSGVLASVTDNAGNITGWIVTARARERYNALVEAYGATMWSPPIGRDYGVTPSANGHYLMTSEAMAKFIAMSSKARMVQGG